MKFSLLLLAVLLSSAVSSPIPERLKYRVPEPDSLFPAHRLKYLPRKRVPALVNQGPRRDQVPKVDDPWRLPLQFAPVSYYVRLLPFIEVGNFTTDGYVEMVVQCVQSTSNITFHSNQITLDYASILVLNLENESLQLHTIYLQINY